jgi:ribosomal RNA-processing protein 12
MSMPGVHAQFASELGGVAPALLPAVLMLLRSRAREVVKAVLGFVKVPVQATHLSVIEPACWCAGSPHLCLP